MFKMIIFCLLTFLLGCMIAAYAGVIRISDPQTGDTTTCTTTGSSTNPIIICR